MSRAAIDHSLSRGRLRALHRGVYAVGHLALPEWALELAAVLAIGDRAYLSHASAASLWGLAPAVRDAVHVTLVGRDAGRRRPGIAVHQAGALAAGDVTVRDGIPVTTAARSVLDIAPGLSDRQLERTFDAGLKERVFTRAAVAAVLDRAGLRHPGAGRLRRLVSAELRTSTITRSRAEERMLELVRAGGLTMPEVNVALGPYEVDFLWREARLVVEVDGYEFHSTRRSFDSDHERDLELRSAGYDVMRFTCDQIVNQPELVLAKLAQRLGMLAAALSRAG